MLQRQTGTLRHLSYGKFRCRSVPRGQNGTLWFLSCRKFGYRSVPRGQNGTLRYPNWPSFRESLGYRFFNFQITFDDFVENPTAYTRPVQARCRAAPTHAHTCAPRTRTGTALRLWQVRVLPTTGHGRVAFCEDLLAHRTGHVVLPQLAWGGPSWCPPGSPGSPGHHKSEVHHRRERHAGLRPQQRVSHPHAHARTSIPPPNHPGFGPTATATKKWLPSSGQAASK